MVIVGKWVWVNDDGSSMADEKKTKKKKIGKTGCLIKLFTFQIRSVPR